MHDQHKSEPEAPQRCECGELLDMEMERDEGRCANCMCELALRHSGNRAFALNQRLARVPAHI